MTALRQNETQHRSPKKKRKPPTKKVRRPLDAPVDMHPSQVLTFPQWCLLNNISARTGARILASGEGPVVTQLSEKRIGVTVGNNAAWQARRSR